MSCPPWWSRVWAPESRRALLPCPAVCFATPCRHMHQRLFGALLQRAGMEVLRDEAHGGGGGGGSRGQHKPPTRLAPAPGPLSVGSLHSHPQPQPGEDVTLALLLRGLAWAHCYDEVCAWGLWRTAFGGPPAFQ